MTNPRDRIGVVEKLEPPTEPDGYFDLGYSEHSGWACPGCWRQVERTREAATKAYRDASFQHVRLVRIAPAPSPAETGAVPWGAIAAILAAAETRYSHSFEGSIAIDKVNRDYLERAIARVRAGLATQKGTR